MEKTPRCSALPVTLVVFLLLAVESGGAEDPNGAPPHVRIQARAQIRMHVEDTPGRPLSCFDVWHPSGEVGAQHQPRQGQKVRGGRLRQLCGINGKKKKRRRAGR